MKKCTSREHRNNESTECKPGVERERSQRHTDTDDECGSCDDASTGRDAIETPDLAGERRILCVQALLNLLENPLFAFVEWHGLTAMIPPLVA